MWVFGLLLVLAVYGIIRLAIIAVQFLVAHLVIVALIAVMCVPLYFTLAAWQRHAYRARRLRAVAEQHEQDIQRIDEAAEQARRDMKRIVDEW